MESVNEAKAVWPGVQNLYVVQELLDQNKCVFSFFFFALHAAVAEKKKAGRAGPQLPSPLPTATRPGQRG
jgi:hypothetical protein